MGRRECFSVLVTLPVVVCSAGFVRPGNQAVRLWVEWGYLPKNCSAERRCRAYGATEAFPSQGRVIVRSAWAGAPAAIHAQRGLMRYGGARPLWRLAGQQDHGF